MKILFTSNPGIGHVLPMLPLAKALQDAGHKVIFATARSFCRSIEEKGFRTYAAGLDWLESETVSTFPEILALPLEEQGTALMTNIFADIAAHRMIPDLLSFSQIWEPDLIVRNDFEFGGYIVAERMDIPHITLGISFFQSVAALEPLIGEQLAYLRSLHGLNPYPALDALYHYAYLSFAPQSFQPRFVPVMHALRPTIMKWPGEEVPEWCKNLPDQPTVYASMSSVYRVQNVFSTIIDGLRDEPVNLIITVGRNQDPADFGSQPQHIHIERYIPQAALFPYCNLFITHSPFSTLMAALTHGLPVLMLPISGELLIGAMRAAELGLGQALKQPEHSATIFGRHIPELSSETVRTTVRELLYSPIYRTNAARVQREIQELPSLERAVELLVSLARNRVPVIATYR